MHTSRSPENAPSTLACALSSTELSGTRSSFANLRNAAPSSPGTAASCSPTPGVGSRVQRGSAANPPATRTERQNSRPRSVGITLSPFRNAILLISDLPRRVPAPPRLGRDVLALHQEGV